MKRLLCLFIAVTSTSIFANITIQPSSMITISLDEYAVMQDRSTQSDVDFIENKLTSAERFLIGDSGKELKSSGLIKQYADDDHDNYFINLYSYNSKLAFKRYDSGLKVGFKNKNERDEVCQNLYENIIQKPTVIFAETYKSGGLIRKLSCHVSYVNLEKI